MLISKMIIMNSDISLGQERLCLACSLKKCCLFLLLFIGPLVTIFGFAALIIVFVVKPQKPIFSLQTVNIDSYKLDAFSDSTLFVSSVVSLTLNARNPNKVGIRYSHSRLRLFNNDGLVIGMIRVPKFYQPARSSNVSVPTRLFFDCMNVSAILSGVTSQPEDDDSNKKGFAVRIVGDIEARLQWVLHIKMPKIKVALDCDVGIDYRYLAFTNEVNSLKAFKNHLASIPANPHTFSNKCSISIYV